VFDAMIKADVSAVSPLFLNAELNSSFLRFFTIECWVILENYTWMLSLLLSRFSCFSKLIFPNYLRAHQTLKSIFLVPTFKSCKI
jgi:hypothetical protein